MNYNDMISTKCNSSTDLAEVYDCINQKTFNITEMIPVLMKGAGVQPERKRELHLENLYCFTDLHITLSK